jgi:zinc protease
MFANGLKVLLAERHAAPLLNVSLFIGGGAAADPAAIPGIGSLEQRFLREGTCSRSAGEIARELEVSSASIETYTDVDWSVVVLDTLKPSAKHALEVYADVVLNPAFTTPAFVRIQRERLSAIRQRRTVPEKIALRIVPGLVYGMGHPYSSAFTGEGTEASVRRMTRDDLERFYRKWFKPNNGTLLIVGDVTMSEVKDGIGQIVANWRRGDVEERCVPIVPQRREHLICLLDRPGLNQSFVCAAQVVPAADELDALTVDLVNHVFGGSFESRLNQHFRETRCWSYNARSVLLSTRHQRLHMSYLHVQADKTTEAMVDLLQQYEDISRVKPISARETHDAQMNVLYAYPGRRETVRQLADTYRESLRLNLAENYFESFWDRTMAVTDDNMNDVAVKSLRSDGLVWLIIGDMKAIETDVRGLGIGAVHRIDEGGSCLGEPITRQM